MKLTTIHDQAYEYHSWEDLGEEMFVLAKKILEKGDTYDRVIALAKGGLTFSRSLTDYIQIKELSSIQIEFYLGIGTTNKTPVITQSLPVSVKNENVLVFDDVVDKGDTMKLATDYLQYHGVKNLTTAALIAKPWSKYPVDFFATQSESWVIFPNESRETIHLLRDIWQKKGDSPEKIAAQCLEIGFPKAEVEFFLQIK